MNTIIKFGLAALAAGTFFASTVPARADEYASASSNYFTKHGLPIPGTYFKAKENQQTTTIAVSTSGHGIGEGKQPVSNVEKKRTHHVRSATKDS